VELERLVTDFAKAMKQVDSRGPRARSPSGRDYQPGIGPFTEPQALKLVTTELQERLPGQYRGQLHLEVPYSDGSNRHCDLCIGEGEPWDWAIETKMLRMRRDNGDVSPHNVTHFLSPYPQQRSALSDFQKLAESELGQRRAMLLFGYDYPGFPANLMIDALDLLASQVTALGARVEATCAHLIHPVHQSGVVVAWEIMDRS
jgi:hypothetical protein